MMTKNTNFYIDFGGVNWFKTNDTITSGEGIKLKIRRIPALWLKIMYKLSCGLFFKNWNEYKVEKEKII